MKCRAEKLVSRYMRNTTRKWVCSVILAMG